MKEHWQRDGTLKTAFKWRRWLTNEERKKEQREREREKQNEAESEKRQDTPTLVGLLTERVGGRTEPCRSDRPAELKPSSDLLSCPADVKVSAPGWGRVEGGDAWRMLTAQVCL